MASKKISELDSITLAQDNDLLLIVQDGVSDNITKANLLGSYNNTVTGSTPVIFGINQTSTGSYNTTVGLNQTVKGTNNTTIGIYQVTGGEEYNVSHAVTVGFYNQNYNSKSVVLGNYNSNPYDSNKKSVVIGSQNTASGAGSTNIGIDNTSSSGYSTVIGCYSSTANWYAIAIGCGTNASGIGSTCIGYDSTATNQNSIAIGAYTRSEANAAIAMGNVSTYGSQSIVIGGETSIPSTGGGAVAIGWSNTSNYVNDVTIGQSNLSSSFSPYSNANVSLGKNNVSKGYGNITIGTGQGAYGIGSICIGGGYTNANYFSFRNYARGYLGGEIVPDSGKYPEPYNDVSFASRTAIAIGQRNNSYGPGTISMGYKNEAVGFGSISIGWENTSFLNIPVPQMANTSIGFSNISSGYFGSTAIGAYNIAAYSPVGMTALGVRNSATAPYATAIGAINIASGVTSTAIGYENSALNNASLAIGCECIASANYANAIGYQSKARVSQTTNIRGPIIVSQSDGTGGGDFVNFGGVENILMTGVIDLTSTGNWQINIPSGASFYVDEVGIIGNQINSVSGQPTISFDCNGTPGALIATTAVNLNNPGDRNIFSPVLNNNAQTNLGITSQSAATASQFTARAYFKGILIENQS